ncbi:hypothetical protein [Paracoccus sp. C2R09]|uniref:hypothetical protein n=1 Tax=Paracoccus sp. C2R09 TaxID=2839896 RepID=UPI001C093889|nr:hypothetical protein [Paracoccus sp. C2R09]MBU2956056.1 hypothetical protein [Paracoccus sp. C2R09]
MVESLMIAVLLSFVVIQAVIRVDFPRGIEALLWNIGVRGLLFFTLGFAFSETLTRLGNRSALDCALGLLIWAAAYYTLKNIDISRTTSQMLLGVPATFGAVYALRYLIARLPAMTALLGRLGRRSLELFLTHQFFIGVAYIVLKPVLPYVSALTMLALTSGAVLLLSYLAASVLRRLPGNMLFSVPALGGRGSEGPPSAEVSSTRTFAGPRSGIPN